MATSGAQKSELITKLRAVNKIINDPSSNPLLSAVNNIKDLADNGIGGKVNNLNPQKLTDLQKKSNTKKENKTNIFSDLIDITDAFLTNPYKNYEINNPLQTKSRVKQITTESVDVTLKSVKQIVLNASQQVLFVGDGICGTNKTFPNDTVTLNPSDFDFLNQLKVDPNSNAGQIMYEGLNNSGLQQLNRDLYNSFSGGTINVNTPNGQPIMKMTWDPNGQMFNVSGLTNNSVNDFVNHYYSSIEQPDISGVTKTAMLMTLNGDQGMPKQFDISLNFLNRLLEKICKNCQNPPPGLNQSNSQFNSNDEIEESYFDFDDVEGIDLDEENRRFKKVLKFKDCNNFEVPTDVNSFEDFVLMTNPRITNKYNLNQVVDSTLYNVALNSYQASESLIPLGSFHINLVNLFILSLPKALMGSVTSPKFLLPIVIIYKTVVLQGQNIVMSAKDLMKKLYKLFTKIIKDIFWKFITEFWNRIKKDLLEFLMALALKILSDMYKKYAKIIAGLIALITKVLQTNLDNCNALFNVILKTINAALSASSINLPMSGLLASFSNLRGSTDPNKTLLSFVENAQKNGVNTNDLHGEPNKLIDMAKTLITAQHEDIVNNGIVAGGNETGFGIAADGKPVMIPRGALKTNGILY
jgi:hypothetical protein